MELQLDHVTRLIEALDHPDTVEAIVQDGWPKAMVTQGLALHQVTWDLALLKQAIANELSLMPYATRAKHVLHIWPAGPGSGLTPMLFGWMLGIQQSLRPSSRTTHFATHLQAIWNQISPLKLDLIQGPPCESWSQFDHVILSGSDEVVAQLRLDLGGDEMPSITGYGHRVSFALLDNLDHALNLPPLATALAKDIVMWHQTGCFSPRALFYLGQNPGDFAQMLADAIAKEEAKQDAFDLPSSTLGERAQTLGMAAFFGDTLFEARQKHVGWVQLMSKIWEGEQLGPHAISLHVVDSMEAFERQVRLPRRQLQGCALAVGDRERQEAWVERLAKLGVTRVCPFGTLQAPKATWWHDGMPNLINQMLHPCSVEFEGDP